MELPPQKIAGRLKQPLLVKGRRKTAVDIALASAVERGPSRGVPDFLVTNGLPDIAEDGTGRATESRFGIKFIQHQNKEHPEKLLEYETEQLERDPFSIILDTTRRASVLAMPHVLGSMARCAVTSLAAIAASLVMEDEVMSVISAVNSVISAGLFFLLGPYVGLCITRWWQVRMDFLGGMTGAIADLNMWASVWFHSGSKGDEAARSLVQRYGLLAHMLIYKDARGQTSVDDAIAKGLLLPQEAAVLQPLTSRPSVSTQLAPHPRP